MAKGSYIGVNGVARKNKAHNIGIGGVARKAKTGFIGVGGVARKFLESVLWIYQAGTAVIQYGTGVQINNSQLKESSIYVYGGMAAMSGAYTGEYQIRFTPPTGYKTIKVTGYGVESGCTGAFGVTYHDGSSQYASTQYLNTAGKTLSIPITSYSTQNKLSITARIDVANTNTMVAYADTHVTAIWLE